MEDLTNVTTEETKVEVTTPEVSDNAERDYDDYNFDNNSSGGNGLKVFAVGSAIIGGLSAIGIAAYDKHKKKKEAEDKKKWNRDVNNIPKKEDEAEDTSEPDEVVDEKDVPKNTKKK